MRVLTLNFQENVSLRILANIQYSIMNIEYIFHLFWRLVLLILIFELRKMWDEKRIDARKKWKFIFISSFYFKFLFYIYDKLQVHLKFIYISLIDDFQISDIDCMRIVLKEKEGRINLFAKFLKFSFKKWKNPSGWKSYQNAMIFPKIHYSSVFPITKR